MIAQAVQPVPLILEEQRYDYNQYDDQRHFPGAVRTQKDRMGQAQYAAAVRVWKRNSVATRPFEGLKYQPFCAPGSQDGISLPGAGCRRRTDVCDGKQQPFDPG